MSTSGIKKSRPEGRGLHPNGFGHLGDRGNLRRSVLSNHHRTTHQSTKQLARRILATFGGVPVPMGS
ncbi:hypothetical protein [Parathermosynechococcus lividus]